MISDGLLFMDTPELAELTKTYINSALRGHWMSFRGFTNCDLLRTYGEREIERECVCVYVCVLRECYRYALRMMMIYQLFQSNINNFATDMFWYIVRSGLVLWHINHCCLFNAKSCFYISIKYLICNHIL